jgi:hypothetical protein
MGEQGVSTLYFQKLSKYERSHEPVTVSIPFAQGRLSAPQHLRVWDDAAQLPLQARALAHWPDGSIKWLLVHLQPDLPGNAAKTLHFDLAPSETRSLPAQFVTAQETPDGVRINTGSLSFLVPRTGFWPLTDVRLDGQPVWEAQAWRGFTLECGGEILTTADGAVELELEEAGPLRAVVLVRGKHRRADGSPYLDFRGRITAYAGKPYVEVEHQFIHAEADAKLTLTCLELAVQPTAQGQPRLALGEGYYQTRIQHSADPLELTLTTETLLYQANEHFIDCFYGDFWMDWRDDAGGVSVSIHQAHQNFPKALRVEPGRLICSLYPRSAPPAEIHQGVAKTHRVLLHFHAADTPLEEISARSLQFQLPDQPALPPEWFRENNPWSLPFFPERVPARLYTWLNYLQSARPSALGMLHFGDAPDAHYSHQGRGHGGTVWVNNEYDRAHACALYYGLTGQRHVLDSSLVAARHWLDVDLCHYSPDPLRDGGLIIHTAGHVTGGASPSHEWVEGLLDYYHLTGRREGLEAAYRVAGNIMRHMALPHMTEPGHAATREGGWALRAMVSMALATGEERFRTAARRLIDLFLDWDQMFGGMLAPYTSHTMPRVVFMIALTANSMARYLALEDDARVKALIVAAADDLIEHCLGPGGVFYYKELPSLQRPAPTAHVLETLAHAYRLTGQRRYLEIATRQFYELMSHESPARVGGKKWTEQGAVIEGEGGGRPFADKYSSLILFAGAAAPMGLLDWFEYPV